MTREREASQRRGALPLHLQLHLGVADQLVTGIHDVRDQAGTMAGSEKW
jgi:hypothetical protein